MSLLRGKSNIVQVFDTCSGEIEQSFDLSESVKTPIKGLHTFCASGDTPMLSKAKHVIVDESAKSYLLDHDSGALDPLFTLKGSHVHKTHMLNSKALT